MPSKKVNFLGSEAELAASLELPEQLPAKAYAIFAHCFSCSKETLSATRVSKALTNQGIAVLRFDFTGLGGSEGDFSNTDFSSNVDDILAAADYLKENFEAPSLMIGHSLGGTAMLAAASQLAEVKAAVTIGSPSDPSHVTHLFQESIEEIESKGKATVNLEGRKFTIKKSFIDDVEHQHVLSEFSKSKKALLLFHSPNDKIVSIDEARKIYDAVKHPKSFISLPGANHLLTKREDAEYVANVIASWSSRYICFEEIQKHKTNEADTVIVSESELGKYTQDIIIGHHHLIGDEPNDAGGLDLGPTPYGYLLASYGSCTNMTIRMYCEHKKIPLDHVRVELNHEKIHAEDCQDCESKEGKIDLIKRTIQIEGDLTEEQRDSILKIANKCPVHRTLNSEIKITTEMD